MTEAVSVIIPALLWDGYLERAIESIRHQVISDDMTIEVIVALASTARAPASHDDSVVIVGNPEGAISPGLNRAIAEGHGGLVIRVDSRCVLPPDYVSRMVELLSGHPEIGCVGGGQVVIDDGVLGSAYASAYNSPLLGMGWYRWRGRSGSTDTTYLGAWRRKDLERIGGFDERLLLAEDSELAQRIRTSGLKVWYDGSIGVGYTAARRLSALMRHQFDMGLWRAMRKKAGQRSYERRHIAVVAAASLLLVGIGSRLTAGPGLPDLLTMSGLFVVAALGAGWSATKMRRKVPSAPRLSRAGILLGPVLAALLAGSWAAGMMTGFSRVSRISASVAPRA